MIKIKKAALLGAGMWGSALAEQMARNGVKVSAWEYSAELFEKLKQTRKHPNLPGFRLHKSVKLCPAVETALEGADLIVIATSSKAVRPLAGKISDFLDGRKVPIVSAVKGIEENTLLTMCEVVEKEIPQAKGEAMALSGPTFALELAKQSPTKAVLAGQKPALMKSIRNVFARDYFVLDLSLNRRTVEWGGAIKNVLAIACGIIDGLGAGANARAALMTEGMAEMTHIISAIGGDRHTVYGLSGFGDFILTGTSSMSRNTSFGQKIGRGLSVLRAEREIGTAVEGINSVKSVLQAVKKYSVHAPVIKSVAHIILEGEKPSALLKAMGFNV